MWQDLRKATKHSLPACVFVTSSFKSHDNVYFFNGNFDAFSTELVSAFSDVIQRPKTYNAFMIEKPAASTCFLTNGFLVMADA